MGRECFTTKLTPSAWESDLSEPNKLAISAYDGCFAAAFSKNGSSKCAGAPVSSSACIHTAGLSIPSAIRQQTCLPQDGYEIFAARACFSIGVRISATEIGFLSLS